MAAGLVVEVWLDGWWVQGWVGGVGWEWGSDMKTLEMRSASEESVQLYDWLMCGVSKLPPHEAHQLRELAGVVGRCT